MSKELVISAASHERRVAILEEGQLVEIYIERESHPRPSRHAVCFRGHRPRWRRVPIRE
jgi:hypothetical protein